MVDASNPAFTKQGDDFRKKGDSARKGSFFGNLMTGKEDRDNEAKELYKQASNCYKAGNDKESAVECLLLCLECEPENLFKASFLSDAAKIIKSVNSDKYVKFINQAIGYYSIAGRTSSAATLAKDCAEKCEEDFNYELAIKMYEQAAQLYESDSQTSYANTMLLKWCDLTIISAEKLDFAKLIKTYEKVGYK